MQQLRLFLRESRYRVLLVTTPARNLPAVHRRLRRSKRFDIETVELDALSERMGATGEVAVDAVVLALGETCEPDSVAAVAADAAIAPVVAVSASRSEDCLEALEAGAEELLDSNNLTSSALERSILSAIYRRSSEMRVTQRSADPLTGLATRGSLDTDLPEMLRDSGPRGVAALFCDLDRFKVINDTHGHAVGDAILKEAAVRLGRAVRSSDLVVRIGGDEFVVVIRSSLSVDLLADEVGERIVQAFSAPFRVGDQSLSISVSVGLATHRQEESATDLLSRADRALYLAKKQGKARVVRYDERMDRVAARKATSAELLGEGVRRDLLDVEVRPIIDTESMIAGHLYRPNWGRAPSDLRRSVPVQSPSEIAAESGGSSILFRWSLSHLVHEAHLPRVGRSKFWLELPRSVLMSSPGKALERVTKSQLPADSLILLINEADLADSASLRSGLLELGQAGVRVAIQNFGANSASLSLLESHPFEAVWIDRQILDGLASCPIRRAKLSAIAHVAAALGQQVVIDRPTAENDRETASQLDGLFVVDGSLDITTPQIDPNRIKTGALRR